MSKLVSLFVESTLTPQQCLLSSFPKTLFIWTGLLESQFLQAASMAEILLHSVIEIETSNEAIAGCYPYPCLKAVVIQ